MKEKFVGKLNKTFARRIGKKLSNLNRSVLDNDLPKVLYSHEKLINTDYNKVFLEIGYGMGEHFVHQVKSNPDNLYIGVEVYLNGVASVLKNLQHHQHNNFMLWSDDLDIILQEMPENSLDCIYVLFPDPWHKKRNIKRRLFNKERVSAFKRKLKNQGVIVFASDIEDYFSSAKNILEEDGGFIIMSNDFSMPYPGYIKTKYHLKAISEERKAQFLLAHGLQV
jgi:release factor glutamine methyltransferase